jgi:primosomal protein N' (replication factor Y)
MSSSSFQPSFFPESPLPVTSPAYVRVLVNLPAKGLHDKCFTYRVPEEFQSLVQVGQAIIVPFGGQPELVGFITDVLHALPESEQGLRQLRDIAEVTDETPLFDAAYYEFICWVADYYATPIFQVLSCALPAALLKRLGKRVHAGPAMQDPLAWAAVMSELNTRLKPSERPAQQRAAKALAQCLLTRTEQSEGYRPRYLANRTGLSNRTLNRLLAWLKSRDAIIFESDWKAQTAPKTQRLVFAVPLSQTETSLKQLQEGKPFASPIKSLSIRQQAIVDAVLSKGETGLSLSELLQQLGTTAPTIKKLAEAGWLRIEDVVQTRDSLSCFGDRIRHLSLDTGFTLSVAQHRALETVLTAKNPAASYLLYGVTGSGKTEVYMSMAREMMALGQSVLLMVPEIALTSQIARRFIRYFGPENVALWHSNLSDGERADTWRKLQAGEIPILIGARSAIWAPLPNLGLILIDEAHEGSFKQDSPEPRYDARVLAEELAKRRGIPLVLGSATPDLGSFYQAQKNGTILHLPDRFGNPRLASVEIADMSAEKKDGNRSPLSRLLKSAIATNLEAKEQTIILLNRRGFFTTIQCVNCEHTFQCAHCDVSLTYHRSKNRVICHYCGFEGERPSFCPACASGELNHTGLGTQRLEEEVIKQFPEARVLRLDGDIMQRKNAHLEVFEAFSSHEADILIGTQIVAKGLDVANVTLVGILNADASFALPDFKSAERGFQLLTQVAGRSGRGSKAGRVVTQAIQIHHPVLKHAAAQDYPSFYEEEIAQRELLGFPPFSQLFRFIASGPHEDRTQQYIAAATLHLREAIKAAGLEGKLTLMGPAPCVLPRLRDRYRFHLLAKNFAGDIGHRTMTDFYRRALDSALPDDLHWLMDVDAQSLL